MRSPNNTIFTSSGIGSGSREIVAFMPMKRAASSITISWRISARFSAAQLNGSISSARASISYRGPFVDAGSGTGNIFEGYEAITNVDASVRYKVTDWMEVSVEGTNLTDAYRTRWVDVSTRRAYENNHFGRTILFGVRLKM